MALSAAEPRAVVALRNGGLEPVRLEVTAMAWGQSPEGQMELSPTAEIVVYPPLLTIGAGDERNLRVGTTIRAAGPAERSFRIFIQELPPAEKPGESQVRVLTRLGLPVFVAPTRPLVRVELDGLRVERGRARFALKNGGTVHLAPLQIRIQGLGGSGEAVLAEKAEAWYVLPGGERRFDVALPAPGCAEVRALSLEAAPEREKEPLRARIDLPAGACGP